MYEQETQHITVYEPEILLQTKQSLSASYHSLFNVTSEKDISKSIQHQMRKESFKIISLHVHVTGLQDCKWLKKIHSGENVRSFNIPQWTIIMSLWQSALELCHKKRNGRYYHLQQRKFKEPLRDTARELESIRDA